MANRLERRAATVRQRLSKVPLCAVVSAASLLLLVGRGARAAEDVRVCPSVAGAACSKAPSPDTPVAPEYAESYREYLKLRGASRERIRSPSAAVPDWSGIWTGSGGFSLALDPKNDPIIRFLQYGETRIAKEIFENCASFPCPGFLEAALTPEYAARYLAKMAAASVNETWDQLSDCLPAGFPRWLTEPFLREFIVTPRATWAITEQQSEVRRIYTDGRGHVPAGEAFSLWEGDSIGFWDGDTLVVHTIHLKRQELQRYSPGLSEQLSTIERIRMTDPNTIRVDVTLYDPKALKAPWHGRQTFSRVTTDHVRIDMWSCAENNNIYQNANGGTSFILPGESITLERPYRHPENFQNSGVDRAVSYGEKLMREGLKPGTKAGRNEDRPRQ